MFAAIFVNAYVPSFSHLHSFMFLIGARVVLGLRFARRTDSLGCAALHAPPRMPSYRPNRSCCALKTIKKLKQGLEQQQQPQPRSSSSSFFVFLFFGAIGIFSLLVIVLPSRQFVAHAARFSKQREKAELQHGEHDCGEHRLQWLQRQQLSPRFVHFRPPRAPVREGLGEKLAGSGEPCQPRVWRAKAFGHLRAQFLGS